jgi:hypothetical protein
LVTICSIKLVQAGVLPAIQSHPIPYADVQCILDTLFHNPNSKSAAVDAPSSSQGGPSSSQHDKETATKNTERLNVLAMDLGLTSAENTPSLSEEDRVDLATFDELTRCQALIQHVLGIVENSVDTQTWNCDTSTQLATLARLGNKIPFGTPGEKTASTPTSAPLAPASAKGKEREMSDKGKGKEKSSDHEPQLQKPGYALLPGQSGEAPMDQKAVVDPLPAMERPEQTTKFQDLFPNVYADHFGEEADHYCAYRTALFDVLRQDYQRNTTQHLSRTLCDLSEKPTTENFPGLLSGPHFHHTHGFWSPLKPPSGTGPIPPTAGADSTPVTQATATTSGPSMSDHHASPSGTGPTAPTPGAECTPAAQATATTSAPRRSDHRASNTPPMTESEDETDSGSDDEETDSGSAFSEDGAGDSGNEVLEADTIDATFSTS